MKRYDEFRYIESKQTGAKTYNLFPDEWGNFIRNPLYKVIVRCRNCNCHHDINSICPVCDLETKIRKVG